MHPLEVCFIIITPSRKHFSQIQADHTKPIYSKEVIEKCVSTSLKNIRFYTSGMSLKKGIIFFVNFKTVENQQSFTSQYKITMIISQHLTAFNKRSLFSKCKISVVPEPYIHEIFHMLH